ncbi:MAG: type III-B CRISPR-associated protein Cas10/Cmr2 [Phormidium sp.]
MIEQKNSVIIAIAWCLAWGDSKEPPKLSIDQIRQAVQEDKGKEVPEEVRKIVEQVKQLATLKFPNSLEELKQLTEKFPTLWNAKIGLVYGGATKIKQYVFEASKLPDIRGASGLLDRINLVDLPAFFKCEESDDFPQCKQAKNYCQQVRNSWLEKPENFPSLSNALIPELVIYSTGGNILAFCPAALVDDLANAIEKRYTEETLTANSCAVGKSFKLLEIRFGLLQDNIEETFWLDSYRIKYGDSLVKAYYGCPKNEAEIPEFFQNRKSFNELAGDLASLFNQRRNGNDLKNDRPLRRYPPIFETHPYLRRDAGDRRSATFKAPEDLPGNPWFSETLRRKRAVSELAKDGKLPSWYELDWQPGAVDSWVNKFKQFLHKNPHRYYENIRDLDIKRWQVDEAKSVREISNASKPQGFIAYIYADGNNMGGYIQKIQTPEQYKKFSQDVFQATEGAVYEALAEHLRPHELKNLTDPDNKNRNGTWIHPFEIITIGGDDVLLIVPADKALAIAQTIGEEFEKEMRRRGYGNNEKYIPNTIHRYQVNLPTGSDQSELSMSIGVLITAEETPIYYAEKLTSQLLKSAKKRAKELKKRDKDKKDDDKKKGGYYGGTVDFLVMKGVTMISSNIGEFRNQGLTKEGTEKQPKLKLYGAPYTLYELKGLLDTAKALKDSQFPRSQLYQIRSLLERGKHTAILNYRYFRTRLAKDKQELLTTHFEDAWCQPKNPSNQGNLAPWMTLKEDKNNDLEKMTYETIWRELVDLYPFIQEKEETPSQTTMKSGSKL